METSEEDPGEEDPDTEWVPQGTVGKGGVTSTKNKEFHSSFHLKRHLSFKKSSVSFLGTLPVSGSWIEV